MRYESLHLLVHVNNTIDTQIGAKLLSHHKDTKIQQDHISIQRAAWSTVKIMLTNKEQCKN